MNRHAKKQDVADKVKEIKLRQKNWMKQRAETRESQSPPVIKETKPEPPKPSQHYGTTKQNDAQKSSIQNVLSSNKSHAKFKSWVKAREAVHETQSEEDSAVSAPEQYIPNHSRKYEATDYGDNQYTDHAYRDHRGSQDVNYLRVPSNRLSEFATPDPEWNSDDETGEITQAQLMSPQDFEAKADDIIAKVKGDLGMAGKSSHYTSSKEKLGSKTADIGQRDRTSHKETKGYNSSGAEITNHTCPICENLMMPPNYNPMLLIPCGHTLCGQCCKVVKFCGQCSCSIQSFTANIMLQQIISKYNTKPVKPAVPSHAERERYREEYQNLITRQEILHEESNSVKKNIQKLSKKLSQEHQQVENILEEEKMIEAKIQSLQDRLRVLVEHRCEYEQTCDSIQTETKQEKNKLVLIQDTLKSINDQMEKVKKKAV